MKIQWSVTQHPAFNKFAMARLIHPDAVAASRDFQANLIDDMRANPDAWSSGHSKVPQFFEHYIDSGSRMTAGPSVLNPMTGEYMQGSEFMHGLRAVAGKVMPRNRTQSKATKQHYDSFASGPVEAYVQLINEGINDFDPKKTVRDQKMLRDRLHGDLQSLGLSDRPVNELSHDNQMDVVRKFMASDRAAIKDFDYGDAERKAFDILVNRRRAPTAYNAFVLRPLQAVDTITSPITDRI